MPAVATVANTLTMKYVSDYSDAQAEFDIEDARWRYAEALAGKVPADIDSPASAACAR